MIDKTINITILFFYNIQNYSSIFIALFAFLTWKLNSWQQEQFKNPIPEFYFSEPQDLAISKKNNKILITFLVYFTNTGTSPIIVSGIEHRIIDINNKEKYEFGKTRFFGEFDEVFGTTTKGLRNIPKLKKLQENIGWENTFKTLFDTFNPKISEDIIISNPYPSQKIEDLWSLNWQVPSGEYVSEKEIDSYWTIKPNELKIKRYYIKIPHDYKTFNPFQIKIVLHYYCGSKTEERLRTKNFKIQPVLGVNDSFLYYTADIDERKRYKDF
jgi:hypothetical protein